MPDAKQPPGPSKRMTARQRIVMELIGVADDLRRYFTALYEPHGITSQQYNVLRILRGAHPDPLPTMDIAERMVEKTPGITRLLDRLESHGWIVRERPPKDRRRVLVSITDGGLDLLRTLDDPVREATSAVLAGLTGGEVARLGALLERIRRGLEA